MRCSSIALALAITGSTFATAILAPEDTSTASAACTYTPVPSPPKSLHCGSEGTLSKPDLIQTIKPKQAVGPPDAYCLNQCEADSQCISFSFSNTGICKLYGKTLLAQGIKETRSGVIYYNRRCFACEQPTTTISTTASTTTSTTSLSTASTTSSTTTSTTSSSTTSTTSSTTPTSTPLFRLTGVSDGLAADQVILGLEEDNTRLGFDDAGGFTGEGQIPMIYYIEPSTGQVFNADSQAGICINDYGQGSPYGVIECTNPSDPSTNEYILYCAINPTTQAFGDCTSSGGQNVSSFSLYYEFAYFLFAGPSDDPDYYEPVELFAFYNSTTPPTTPSPFQLQGSGSGSDADGQVIQSDEGNANPAGFDLSTYFGPGNSNWVNMTYTLDQSTGAVNNVDGSAGLSILNGGSSTYNVFQVVECEVPNNDGTCHPISCQIDPVTLALGGCTGSGNEDLSAFFLSSQDGDCSSGCVLYAGPVGAVSAFPTYNLYPVNLTAITPY